MKIPQKQILNIYIDTINEAINTSFNINDIVFINEVNEMYYVKISTTSQNIPNIIVCNDGKRLIKIGANNTSNTPIVDTYKVELNTTQTMLSYPDIIEFNNITQNNLGFSLTNNTITVNENYNRIEFMYKVVYYSDRNRWDTSLVNLNLNSLNLNESYVLQIMRGSDYINTAIYSYINTNSNIGDEYNVSFNRLNRTNDDTIIIPQLTNIVIKGFK